MAYYPTFGDFSKSQMAWYLYWRHQWEQGRVLETDLSYIFVLVYEFLNLAYEPDAEKSYAGLARLYGDYRDQHPKLDNYLPQWLGDFAWEHGMDEQAAEWYAQAGGPLFQPGASPGAPSSRYDNWMAAAYAQNRAKNYDQALQNGSGIPLLDAAHTGSPFQL